jgi:hypothetical protein
VLVLESFDDAGATRLREAILPASDAAK